MLTDIVAVITAFCTIMLLFGLLVTTGVEIIHSKTNQRNKNLRFVMNKFFYDLKYKNWLEPAFSSELMSKNELSYKGRSNVELMTLSVIEKVIFESIEIEGLESVDQPHEINIEEIISKIDADLNSFLIQEQKDIIGKIIKYRFISAQAVMSKRFQRLSKRWSFVLALLFALVYQINTPQLLDKLSKDTEFREKVNLYAEEHVRNNSTSFEARFDYSHVVAISVEKLIEANPEKKVQLEEISGGGIETKQQAIQELKSIIKEKSEYEKLEKQYEQILAKEEENQRQKTLDDLGELGFAVMPNGWKYYFKIESKTVENWFGVLISAILISLGAPFWFNNLQTVFSIRDYFGTKSGSKLKPK